MARRTITLSPKIEKGIRDVQANAMKELNREITFTEVANTFLAIGLSHHTPKPEKLGEIKDLLGSEDLATAGLMDKLMDESLSQLADQSKSSK